jgi:glycolate oxidase FAD binding subunit
VRRLLAGRGNLAAVASFLEAVAASTARVTAIDLLDGPAAVACGLGGDGFAGLVLCEGQRAVVDGQAHAVARLAAAAGVTGEVIEGDALDRVWEAWVDLGSTDDLGAGGALLTINTTPARVTEAMTAIGRAAEEHELACWRWARAGNGLVYAKLGKEAGKAAAALSGAQDALLACWPATTLTAGSPAVAVAARPWGAVPPGLATMRALKERFDPAGILQPGRYVGGI